MTEAEIIEATYFAPWHIILYLFVIFVAMVVYYQWRWSGICKKNIQVLVAQSGGGGDFVLSPKVGGQVAIKNPGSDTVRMWPINELATIEVPYPGVGFVPGFLQKTIRLAIVNEGDWEPMLNRSRHYERVASPDVVESLTEIAVDCDTKMRNRIVKYIDKLSTSPTREMIASPAVLGNLMHEKITEAVITVNKEMLDSVAVLVRRLSKMVTPIMFYIGIGALLVCIVVMAFQVIPAIGIIQGMGEKIDAIQRSLGILTGG